MADMQRLAEGLARIDDLVRERLEGLVVTGGTEPRVECFPANGCGDPFGGPIAPVPPLEVQVAELQESGLLGTVDVVREGARWELTPWGTDKEAKAWTRRVALSLMHPAHAQVLRAAGALKVRTWRQEQARLELNTAIWRADGAMRGVTRTDLLQLSQAARSTFYAALAEKPEHFDTELEELPFDDTPTPSAPTPAAQEPAAPAQPSPVRTQAPAAAAAPVPVQEQVVGEKHARPAPITPAPQGAAQAPTSPARPAGSGSRRGEARFSAPAVVLEGSVVRFADGTSGQWQASHVGELAQLAETYRLGWGGGEDRLPDLGQVWLSPDALTTLGLPISLGVDNEVPDQEKWRSSVKAAFAQIAEAPVFTAAVEAGWEFSSVQAWTRVWHPDKLKAGAWIVVPSWQNIGPVALTAPAPGAPVAESMSPEFASAAVLVKRLDEFARATGVAYRLTPAATGLDLIDHTRPPRRHADDDRGQGRNRAALVRGVAAELPGFLHATDDMRFANLEADFSWWRPWDSLTDSEKVKKFVVTFDRGRSYLAPWSSISLGMEGLTHTEDPVWDGKEEAGYWLIDDWNPEQWPWWLPELRKSAGARIEDDRVWVTTHTLRQLALVGITPVLHESYTWQTNARYLEPAAKQLRAALEADVDPAVTATVKNLYASTVGKLGQREHRTHYHLWRPDWRHHIIAATRTAILRTLITAQERSAAIPLMCDRDTIAYAVDTDIVADAWPGDPKKLGVGIGAWKPAGIADLQTWGPAHLANQHLTWRFRYTEAMAAMQPWGK